MRIVCPSYRRAGKVKTHKIFGDLLTVAVHAFEARQYKKHYKNLMVIPDDKQGNMEKVRNHILENAGDENLVMCDDDLSGICYWEDGNRVIMDLDRILFMIKNGFEMMRDIGTCLMGLNLNQDPDLYREYSPISFLAPVLGPFSMIRKSDVRYDERLGLNEDYDFFLQHIYKYRKVIRLNKYHYIADHLSMLGGCSFYRNMQKEAEQAKLMIRKWGSKVVRYDLAKSTNPSIFIPLPGI